MNREYASPLLLVHGAWHGAWCWDQGFMAHLAERGFEVHALSLRGHGASEGAASIRRFRLADYVEDVACIARQLSAPPVVIGHSMGGAVVQKYLETHAAPAAVLMASVPPAGVLATTLRIHLRHPLKAMKMHALLSLYPLVESEALVREMFFSTALPEAQLADYAARLQNESYTAFLDMLVLNLSRPGKVGAPMQVLGAGRDAIFYPAEVEATARAYGTEAVMFANMAHDMMLEPGWTGVADAIAEWLKTQ